VRTVAHPPLEDVELSDVLHALSDPVRMDIVKRLERDGECPCGSFGVPISKSTLSHHLKVLRKAGLTETRPDGTLRLISLRREEFDERFPELLDSVLSCR
jgi:DNA-binding transcriptional ArsR family regulator